MSEYYAQFSVFSSRLALAIFEEKYATFGRHLWITRPFSCMDFLRSLRLPLCNLLNSTPSLAERIVLKDCKQATYVTIT